MNPLLAPNQTNINPSFNQNEEVIYNQVKSIKNKIEGLKSLSSPQNALDYLVKSNPGMQQALQFVMKCGNDPIAAVDILAKQNGINPQIIHNAINRLF